VLVHEFERLAGGHVLAGGDDLVGHRLPDFVGLADLQVRPDVGARDDPQHLVVLVDDRRARDALRLHRPVDLPDGLAGVGGHDVADDELVGALDALDLGDDLLDVHVSVEHAEPAVTRHRDRQFASGHGVHRRREDRDLELDVRRDARAHVGLVGFDATLLRSEQHVVERQRLGDPQLLGVLPFGVRISRHISRTHPQLKNVARCCPFGDVSHRSCT